MRRIIKMSIALVLCVTFSGISAQSVMYLNHVLDPVPGHAVDLENGVKTHNAKFHATGEAKAYLFAIMTGPRSGQYAWIQGPMSYASMDTPLSAEHAADWDKNVGAFCRNNGEMRIVKRDEATTYNPANEVIAENYLARIFYGVSNVGQLIEAMGMIKKIYETNKVTSARRVYTTEFRTVEDEAVTLVYPFSSFKEFEKTKGLAIQDLGKEMDKVHGAGGMKKFNDLVNGSSKGFYDEVRTMVK